jgi:protein-arginine kinase activator protein McsA
MADVTGPISTLPGSGHSVPEGMICDTCNKNPATVRIQGETDSFGCEMIDLCDECHKKEKEAAKHYDYSGTCEWCKNHTEKLQNTRDYEEGSCGRVYQVCTPCIDKYHKVIDEELSRDDAEFDFGDWDDDY